MFAARDQEADDFFGDDALNRFGPLHVAVHALIIGP